MNKQDITTKLSSTEASLKRWHPRLKRAATMVNQLERQRRRYQLLLLTPEQPVVAVVRVKVPVKAQMTKEQDWDEAIKAPPPGSLAEKYAAQDQAIIEASKSIDVPAFLNRADPHIAAKMTEARKKAEAEERKKMPLTGKAALAKIREKK